MRRTAARCALAGWMIIAICMVTACGQSGSVKQAVGGFASSAAATVTRAASSPPATSAPTTQISASTEGGGGGATASSSAAVTQPVASPSVTAPASATASAQGTSSSAFPWLWAILGAVAFVGLIAAVVAWIVHGHRRRAATTAEWQKQLIDAYAKGAALHDAMAAAEVPGALAAADATARWYDIQRRADDFGQLLYMLRESATDEEDRIRISNVLAALQAARSAMDAERSAGNADSSLATVVRDRLAFFGASLRGLREPNVRPM
jgi:hypothetical protein